LLKKFQWITAIGGLALVLLIYFLGKTAPPADNRIKTGKIASSGEITIDTILHHAKEQLKPEQITWLGTLEKSVIRGDVKSQQLDVYHQLAHFWKDSAGIFEPYAWYEAEAARLENSEKSLSFAGHLFLNNLRSESREPVKKWKAVQARDLFERSLKINPVNDSSLVGLGACYIFGNIAENPMEGIQKIRQVAEKDSANVFAQLMLGHGSAISKQYDRAINRFERVISLQPANLEAIMMLAEVYELKADKAAAVKWYQKAAGLMTNPEFKTELLKRIEDLSR
jgi:tetratricopeptide (TPR) repeat protein